MVRVLKLICKEFLSTEPVTVLVALQCVKSSLKKGFVGPGMSHRT